MRENLDRTGGLVVSERLAAALAPDLGAARARELVTAAAGRAVAEGITLEEALAGLVPGERLRELTDPAGYTGSALTLIDRALHHPPEDPEDPA
jgi:3-carboxy-cis,cis-muconate cycloisomerase